ncbi:MAG: hypothetical protein WCH59_09215 [Chitinophagia bacterium]|jgi:hypothetical protein
MERKHKMTSFTILWHEGTGQYDGQTFTLWSTVQFAFNQIFKHHMKDGGEGYTKVKVNVKWEDGSEITDRLDVSEKDYNPQLETVGEYLSKAVNFYTVMYSSNVKSRHDLSFRDLPATPTPKNSPKTTVKASKIARKQPELIQPTEHPENSPKTAQNSPKTAYITRTFAEIIEMQAQTYLLN